MTRTNPTQLELWTAIEWAQANGLAKTTTYGWLRKEGIAVSVRRFNRTWYLAKMNPFRWNHARA